MQLDYTQKDIDRFWGKVKKTNDQNQCWLWTAYRNALGYGVVRWMNKTSLAHRVAWIINFGDVPEGLLVCHTCDNPPCNNPSHLFLGTNEDNMNDMISKGRQAGAPRESNSKHKLNEWQVEEIRRRYGFQGINGERQVDLAKEFGIGQAQVSSIVRGKSWK